MFKVRQFVPLCTNCFKQSQRNHRVFLIKAYCSGKDPIQDFDAPIKYSTSPSFKYKARTSLSGKQEERLWYEAYVILTSVSIFLIYFGILREENDLDKELNTSLYSRIEGLEESQLRLSLKYNQDNGLETSAINKRLEEIEQQKRTVGTK